MYAVKGFWALKDNTYGLLPFTRMLLRDSGPYGTIFMCYITISMYAVKGFWALWDNIATYAVKEFWALWNNICVLLPLPSMLLRDSGP
jgi:hypothetical protein